jgi:hypothetical protein
MLRPFAFAVVLLALASGAAFAAKGGPSPGVTVGWDGAVDAANGVRYVAMPAARTTTIAAVRTSDGRVERYRTLSGTYGVPLVAFDGTAEGVSGDGRTLVLADVAGSAKETRLLVLRTRTMGVAKRITLPGHWAYDALSRDGRTLYAIQYYGAAANARYAVRSISLETGKPFGSPIVDAREPDEQMNGSPWSRVWSGSGARAYTFYAKPNGTAFVHALDTSRRIAYCIDLPWQSSLEALSSVRLSLDGDGERLVLSTLDARRLAVIDTTSWKVSSFRKP